MVLGLDPRDSILSSPLLHQHGTKSFKFASFIAVGSVLFRLQAAVSSLLGYRPQQLGATVLQSAICYWHVGVSGSRLLVSAATDHAALGEICLVDFGSRPEIVLDRNVQSPLSVRFLYKRAVITEVSDDHLSGRKLLMLENVFHSEWVRPPGRPEAVARSGPPQNRA